MYRKRTGSRLASPDSIANNAVLPNTGSAVRKSYGLPAFCLISYLYLPLLSSL